MDTLLELIEVGIRAAIFCFYVWLAFLALNFVGFL